MATKTEILELFDRLQPALAACALAKEALDTFERQPEPKRPTQIENLDDYLSYIEDHNRWFAEKDKLERDVAVTERAWKELEATVIRTLPAQIWFRHGGVGIGVAYTNWGGQHYYVQIAPWEKEMSSLDHVYRGD